MNKYMKKKTAIVFSSLLIVAAVFLLIGLLYKKFAARHLFEPPAAPQAHMLTTLNEDDLSFFSIGNGQLCLLSKQSTGDIIGRVQSHLGFCPCTIVLQEVNENTVRDCRALLSLYVEGMECPAVYVPGENASSGLLDGIENVIPVFYHDSFVVDDCAFYRINKKGDSMSLVILHGSYSILSSDAPVKAGGEEFDLVLMPKASAVKSKFTTTYLVCGSNSDEDGSLLDGKMSSELPFLGGRTSLFSDGYETFTVFSED